jgi:hypothetical protein
MGASLYNLMRISVFLGSWSERRALIFCTLPPFAETVSSEREKTNWHIYYSNSPKLEQLSQSLQRLSQMSA